MYSSTVRAVPKKLEGEQLERARARHQRLVAALDLQLGGNQSALHRKLVLIEEDLALSTVQAWCRGPDAPRGSAPSEFALRGILVVLGLWPTWPDPPPENDDKAGN